MSTDTLEKPEAVVKLPSEDLLSKRRKRLISDPLNEDNPITIQVLGICSALAVTVKMEPTLIMSIAVVFVIVGAFVGLIITNCIVMGRLEAFAMGNKPYDSILDGLGSGFGYAWIILAVAFFRELFGSGSVFDLKCLKQ